MQNMWFIVTTSLIIIWQRAAWYKEHHSSSHYPLVSLSFLSCCSQSVTNHPDTRLHPLHPACSAFFSCALLRHPLTLHDCVSSPVKKFSTLSPRPLRTSTGMSPGPAASPLLLPFIAALTSSLLILCPPLSHILQSSDPHSPPSSSQQTDGNLSLIMLQHSASV